MMNKDEHAQQKADRALGVLENMRRATPAPFFYTRVQSRIGSMRMRHADHRRSIRVLAGFAAIVALVLLNVVTIVRLTGDSDSSSLGKDNLESFADEYSMSYNLY
jgi:hypothetical protein